MTYRLTWLINNTLWQSMACFKSCQQSSNASTVEFSGHFYKEIPLKHLNSQKMAQSLAQISIIKLHNRANIIISLMYCFYCNTVCVTVCDSDCKLCIQPARYKLFIVWKCTGGISMHTTINSLNWGHSPVTLLRLSRLKLHSIPSCSTYYVLIQLNSNKSDGVL